MTVDRILKTSVFAAAALGGLLGSTAVTLADGMPRAPANYRDYRPCANWAGVYAGAHIGWTRASTDWTWANATFFNFAAGNRESIDPSSPIYGFHGGVQHQLGCVVVGLEGTFSGGDITKDIVSPFFPGSDRHSAWISRVTTVTGRLGYSAGDWLFYGKGGWAGARVEEATHFLAFTDGKSDQWQNGWTVGTGIEVQLGSKIGNGIVFGLEYNFIDLGDRAHNFTCAPACFGPNPVVNTDVQMHVVTARLTFLLGREQRVEAFK